MLNVRDSVLFSRFRDEIVVVGPQTSQPFEGVRFRGVQWSGGTAGYVAAVRKVLVEENPELLEIRQHMQTAERIVKEFPEIPSLFFRHQQLKEPKNWLDRIYRSRRLAQFTRIAFVSQFACELFRQHYPSRAHQGVVAWNGIDTEAYRPLAKPKEKVILYAGRVIPMKGVLEFAEAGREIVRRFPDWKVVVCGEASAGYEEFGEEVAAVVGGMGRQGEFMGYQNFDTIMELFQRAEIAVVPSNWPETFGRTAMEAMTVGAALISSGRGGLREVSGDSARYLSVVNKEELVGAIEALIEDHETRARLQLDGPQRMQECFDIRKTVARIDRLREELAEVHPSS